MAVFVCSDYYFAAFSTLSALGKFCSESSNVWLFDVLVLHHHSEHCRAHFFVCEVSDAVEVLSGDFVRILLLMLRRSTKRIKSVHSAQ